MTLTIELQDAQEAALVAKAREHGVTAEEYAKRVLAHDLESSSPLRRRHISEVIQKNMSRVPSDMLADLPKDGAREHDHYVYGLPKQNPWA